MILDGWSCSIVVGGPINNQNPFDIGLFVCLSVCSFVCLCVCVNHLNRCKTSSCYRCRFRFSGLPECLKPGILFLSNCTSRGAQKAHRAVPNEALYGVLRISRLITWTYLRISVSLRRGKGLSQEPYDDLFGSTRLSQSGIHLFYFIPSWHRAKPRTLNRTS